MLSKVISPISAECAVGQLLQEDTELNFIEDELMKVGSLSHGSIKWEKVKLSAINILETKSKDIKVLSNLLQCIQQETGLESTLLSIKLLSAFITHYWADAYPAQGQKGEKLKQRYFKQIMQRTSQSVKKLQLSTQDSNAIEETLKEFAESLQSAGIDLEYGKSLELAFKGISQTQESEESDRSNESIVEKQVLQSAPDAPNVYFDSKNERATRQALFSMAYFLNQIHPKSPIGYRVRRHALWFSIWQLPQIKKDQTTELAAFSVDRLTQYQQKVEREPSVELLNKIERILEQTPYWFDGHFLSYQLCEKLGFNEVAAAIKEELKSFISRFNQIVHYKAVDGTGFASLGTQQWLDHNPHQNNQLEVSNERNDNWVDEFQKLQELANSQGISASLSQVDQQLKNAKDTRESFYWRLINADLLNQERLTSMAKNEYQVLLENIKEMSIEEWEPSFSGHIQQSLDKIDQAGL